MWPNPQETADLVTFTEEILNRKLHFRAVFIFSSNWNLEHDTAEKVGCNFPNFKNNSLTL